MGPMSLSRSEVPSEELIWQDPIPALDHEVIGEDDISSLKTKILDSGLTVPELVSPHGHLLPPLEVRTYAVEPMVHAFVYLPNEIGK